MRDVAARARFWAASPSCESGADGARSHVPIQPWFSSIIPTRVIRCRLGGVGGNGADVGNVVAFLEGWDRVDVQDDTGDGSAGFEYDFAEIVGDQAELHALLNIGAALHQWVPNAGAVGQDIDHSVEPDGIFDGPRASGKHLESAHGAECSVDQKGDVIRFDDTGIASFDDDGRFTASRSGVVEVASGAQIGGTVAP